MKCNISSSFSLSVFLNFSKNDTVEGAIHYLHRNFGVGQQYVLRRHYGIQLAVPFIKGYHSEMFKFEAYDGSYASAIMKWPAKKVTA